MQTLDVAERLRAALRDDGIDWLLAVPAAGLQTLYDDFDAVDRLLFATREEEAIAIACGIALGAGRPAVVMQQTGVGNAINAVLSLADAYAIPFPIVVCDRTDHDPNPVQRVSSTGTLRALRALGCVELALTEPDADDLLRHALADRPRWIVVPLVGEG